MEIHTFGSLAPHRREREGPASIGRVRGLAQIIGPIELKPFFVFWPVAPDRRLAAPPVVWTKPDQLSFIPAPLVVLEDVSLTLVERGGPVNIRAVFR